jgi:hypothetical protein
MVHRAAVVSAMIGLAFAGFVLGGCGSSHRRTGENATLGSVILRLHPAVSTNDITRVEASTSGTTTTLTLFVHGIKYIVRCTSTCVVVGTQTVGP